jgi:hypothetical protein
LEAISEEIEPGNHAVIIFDRATWHTTKKWYNLILSSKSITSSIS